jgi:RND family efflux transporter MFP subunit
MSRSILKIALPAVVLVAGFAVAAFLVSARQMPERVDRAAPGPLVEVITAAAADVPVVVHGHGEVSATVEVEVVPEVSGRVVEVAPAFVAGGLFAAGEVLVTIESRDYELAVERARASVERAAVALERERAEAEAARAEWRAMHPDQEPPSPLVVREPQLRQASAELEAARAELAAAELDLERTRISLPFAGVVVSESVDVGQYVTPGRAIAHVYGSDRVQVRVPLEDRELAWIDVPGLGGGGSSEAAVRATFAGREHLWEGRVVRLEGQVDPGSRMVHVVVEVPRPFAGAQPPLMVGTFVDVAIDGRTLEGVVAVPRFAVHEGRHVWVVEDDTLHIRQVEVARSDRETALIRAGLGDRVQVVVSALDAVTDGMTVRAVERSTEEAGGGEA